MVRNKTIKNEHLVSKESSTGKKKEKELKAKMVSIEKVENKEKKEDGKVQLSILEHVLVPEMRVISEKEKKELLRRFKITEDKLPKMLSSDPCALALNAKVGDVVEIKRKDAAVEYLYYRIIVE